MKNYILSLTLIALFMTNTLSSYPIIISSTTTHYEDILYTQYMLTNNDYPVIVHVVQAPKKKFQLTIVPAHGQREKVSSIAQRTTQARVAINGANYRRGGQENGERVNAFIHRGTIVNDYGWIRGSLIIDHEHHEYVIDRASITYQPTPALFCRTFNTRIPLTPCLTVLGGAGLLLKNGELVTDMLSMELAQGDPIMHYADEIAADFHNDQERNWLINGAHPRTAIGFNGNDIFFVVVDGRQEQSMGLGLPDLGYFMRQLGCLDALNLGGGGCSTLVINNHVMNAPSQGQERPVSEAIILAPY